MITCPQGHVGHQSFPMRWAEPWGSRAAGARSRDAVTQHFDLVTRGRDNPPRPTPFDQERPKFTRRQSAVRPPRRRMPVSRPARWVAAADNGGHTGYHLQPGRAEPPEPALSDAKADSVGRDVVTSMQDLATLVSDVDDLEAVTVRTG